MPAAGASYTAVDLSRVAAPTVVEQLDYEAILAAMTADLVARDPAFTALTPADPAIVVLQVAAYREFVLRAEFNDRLQGVMLAYARGSDLDQLAANVGVERLVIASADPIEGTPAVFESDADLRQRIVLAPEAFSCAGPAGAYVSHARDAHPSIADVKVDSPTPGQVRVTLLARGGDGLATPQAIAAVTAALNAETVRPLTDQVVVQSVVVVPFNVSAELIVQSGPDAELIRSTAVARLNAYTAERFRIGRDITRAGLIAALMAPGVVNVVLDDPFTDVEVGPIGAPYMASATINVGGVDV